MSGVGRAADHLSCFGRQRRDPTGPRLRDVKQPPIKTQQNHGGIARDRKLLCYFALSHINNTDPLLSAGHIRQVRRPSVSTDAPE